jgi:hypothetical protein
MPGKQSRLTGAAPCCLCGRTTPLTFHHLIPKALYKRNRIKRLYNKEEMKIGINICRKCHNGIHDLYDEMTLALRFNTIEKLRQDPAILKHVSWVAKQH